MILGEVKPISVSALKLPVLIKGGRSHLVSWVFDNGNASDVYIQLFDLVAASSVIFGTTVPTAIIPIAANGGSRDLASGWQFLNGIVAAAATTATGGTGVSTTINGTFGIE